MLSKEQTLSDESLQTLFCEVESIINSRPLTLVSGDAQDLEPLTPNHLLLLKTHQNLSPVLPENTGMCVRKRWKQVQYLADVFWRRWLKEYLPQLHSRQKWILPQRNLKTGDIVLIVNETAPRNTWLTGRVVETLPDNQGYVRQVKLKTKTSVLTRPVHKLCLLLEADGTQQVNETMKSNINKEIAGNQDQEDEEINHKAGETRLRSRPVKPRKILDL
ncbi:uncharacterized protein [Amphiura filiformis]|uniref:uncharacterized protein n=1 Tax=Amphiura filiformis TaxID=82378 RepID=UPI003B215C70